MGLLTEEGRKLRAVRVGFKKRGARFVERAISECNSTRQNILMKPVRFPGRGGYVEPRACTRAGRLAALSAESSRALCRLIPRFRSCLLELINCRSRGWSPGSRAMGIQRGSPEALNPTRCCLDPGRSSLRLASTTRFAKPARFAKPPRVRSGLRGTLR